jgi:hypothetical protein
MVHRICDRPGIDPTPNNANTEVVHQPTEDVHQLSSCMRLHTVSEGRTTIVGKQASSRIRVLHPQQ